MEERLILIKDWLALAEQKIEVANELFQLGYFDDATSRAYYGMFHAAKALLLSIEVEVRSHSGVVSQLNRCFIKTGQLDKEYGRMLATAMNARQSSDYGPQIDIADIVAAGTLNDAKVFVAKIREMLNDNPLL